MKLSDYIFQRLDEWGVGHVFLLPGGGAMHLDDSLGKRTSPVFVATLHEQAAAIAAEAYARVTNHLGVALFTTGPGGTNAMTGLAAAWLDSTPCLFLSGQVKRADLKGDLGVRQLGVQEIDIVAVAGPLTKYARTILDPDSIRYHLEKAVHLARTGRPGPVWLDIPLDVQAAQIDPDQLLGFEPPVPEDQGESLDLTIDTILESLSRAERPVFLGGNGIRLAGATREFLQLAEHLGIPVLTTWLGMDLLPDDHPLFMGRPGAIAPRGANFTLQNADFLLAVGSRLDMAMVGYAYDRLARSAVKAVVDIDPGELRKFKEGVEFPICADAGAFLRGMLDRLGAAPLAPREAWLERCRDWKERYPVVLPEHRERTDFVSTYAFSEALADALLPGALIASLSAGACVEMFLLAFKVKEGQRIFHNRGTGSMGFALPALVGARPYAWRRTAGSR
jgi:acetolactate synthase-1/2/3 large subunit